MSDEILGVTTQYGWPYQSMLGQLKVSKHICFWWYVVDKATLVPRKIWKGNNNEPFQAFPTKEGKRDRDSLQWDSNDTQI